jgi:hypothetical protein
MSLALWGGLAGAGRGISDVGRQMEVDALEERRQRNLAEIAAARDQSREDIAAMRGGRAGSGSGSRSGGGGGGASLRELIDDPEVLAFASAKKRERLDDARAMAKGETPMREVEGAQPMDDEGNVMEGPGAPKKVEKYVAGEAQKVREEGRDALWSALKAVNPAHADDLSKSQRTDQGTKFAAEYKAGDNRAGEAALINDSKPAYDDGSSNATGQVVKGSLAEAKATEAEKKGAAAVTKANMAGSSGGGSKGAAGTELKLEKEDRLAAQVALADARKELTAEEAKMKPDPDKVARAQASVDKAKAALDASGERRAAARDKLTGSAPAKTAAKLSTLPAGAKQIGTSGGRPVYQTPDGKRFIGN